MHLLMHHISYKVFWWNMKWPTWLSSTPDLVPCDFCLFPKTKITFERKRFQTVTEIEDNIMGSRWWLGELCEVPRCLLWKGLRCYPVYNVSCILFNKCLFFMWCGQILSGQTSNVLWEKCSGSNVSWFAFVERSLGTAISYILGKKLSVPVIPWSGSVVSSLGSALSGVFQEHSL